MILMFLFLTASNAGCTILDVSTNHWSVSIGSITTLDRSPKGCMIALLSTKGCIDEFPSVSITSVITAKPSAVTSEIIFSRALKRSIPRYSSGTRFIEAIRLSSQVIFSSLINSAFADASL